MSDSPQLSAWDFINRPELVALVHQEISIPNLELGLNVVVQAQLKTHYNIVLTFVGLDRLSQSTGEISLDRLWPDTGKLALGMQLSIQETGICAPKSLGYCQTKRVQLCRERIFELLKSNLEKFGWDGTEQIGFAIVAALEEIGDITHPVLYAPVDKYDRTEAMKYLYSLIARMWIHACDIDLNKNVHSRPIPVITLDSEGLHYLNWVRFPNGTYSEIQTYL